MPGLDVQVILLDAVIAFSVCLVAFLLIAGTTLYTRAGRSRNGAQSATGLLDTVPSITGAIRLPSVSGRLRIRVRVYTLHDYADGSYHDRDVQLAHDMFPAVTLHTAFPAIGKLAQQPMQMPEDGEALYRVYVCVEPFDRLMAYRKLVKRSGASAESDAHDDAEFLVGLTDMLAAAHELPEDKGTTSTEET